MGYVLREGLSFCITADRTIFLDLRRDRYFCLGPAEEAAFSRLTAERILTVTDARLLAPLLAGGQLRECDNDIFPQACPHPTRPSCSLTESVDQYPSVRRIPAVLTSLATVALMLRTLNLERVVRRIATTKANFRRQPERSLPYIQDTARTFTWSGILTATHDQCLWRSLALAYHLARVGTRSELVFGVMLRPFKAHCWVQKGEVVLNDRLDHVRNFTPILVI